MAGGSRYRIGFVSGEQRVGGPGDPGPESVYLALVFEGGPWAGLCRDKPRLFGDDREHCLPHDGGPSCTWAAADDWPPGVWRYQPVSGPGVEPVVLRWLPPPGGDGRNTTSSAIL